MIFEDVHWIDPTTLEAVGRTVERLKTLPVLLIVTYRPEFDAPWIGRPYVTTFNLNRLDEREIAAMIDRVTGNKAMPDSIKQDIIERTDGIPLCRVHASRYLEEIRAPCSSRDAGTAGVG
jgi:predicted ATPase